MTTIALVDRFEVALPELLDDTEALVTFESPSSDLGAVAASADLVARIASQRLGVEPERIVIEGRTHLRWRFGSVGPEGSVGPAGSVGQRGQAQQDPARVVVLGHHDTVWPIGSLATHPFAIADGVLTGPGCFDMKAGVVMAVHAIAALNDRAGVTLLITGDEEIGSPTSRALIETEASGCVAALVLEASADGGALKVERKGVSLYDVVVHGRAAHAGLEPERGVNATVELAHQILAVSALGDPALGTTVTPTLLAAGTTTNTVPAGGHFAVDVRVRTAAEQDRVDAAMHALRPVLDGARLQIGGGANRPPLDADASAALFARAAKLSVALGLAPLHSAAVGGASDGNFTAGIGVPTLDGLGAVGGGAHADDEHVLVAELPGRTALLAALLTDLLDGTAGS